MLLNRILNIYKKLYGEADGRVGLAMCSVAHAKCAMGKNQLASSLSLLYTWVRIMRSVPDMHIPVTYGNE